MLELSLHDVEIEIMAQSRFQRRRPDAGLLWINLPWMKIEDDRPRERRSGAVEQALRQHERRSAKPAAAGATDPSADQFRCSDWRLDNCSGRRRKMRVSLRIGIAVMVMGNRVRT